MTPYLISTLITEDITVNNGINESSRQHMARIKHDLKNKFKWITKDISNKIVEILSKLDYLGYDKIKYVNRILERMPQDLTEHNILDYVKSKVDKIIEKQSVDLSKSDPRDVEAHNKALQKFNDKRPPGSYFHKPAPGKTIGYGKHGARRGENNNMLWQWKETKD